MTDLTRLWEQLERTVFSIDSRQTLIEAKPIITAWLAVQDQAKDAEIERLTTERDAALSRVAALEVAILDAEEIIANELPDGQRVHHRLGPLWKALGTPS